MIVLSVLIVIIWFVSKKNEKIRFLKEKVIQQPFNYYLLIGLLIIGSFFGLYYTDRYGCIATWEPFETKNILFSVISLTLLLLSFFSKKRTIKRAFILSELLFWILTLFLFKGGYVVGFFGTADPYISFYDTATLALRFIILDSLLRTNINQVFLLICTIIIMSLKIYVFPLPHSFYVAEREWQIITENTKNFLTKGEWIENNTTDKIRLIFYSESAVLYNFQGNDTLCFISVSWGNESVVLESWGDNTKIYFCEVKFKELEKDTLSVNFRYYQIENYKEENYDTQMIRKMDCR